MKHIIIAVIFSIVFTVDASANGRDDERVERPDEIAATIFPPPSEASRRGSVLPGLYAGLAGLQALDVYTTSRGLAQGSREGNPILRGVAGNTTALLIVKGSVTAASIAVSERLWKQHRRRRAIATMIATNGIMAAVATRNVWLIRQPATRNPQ